MRVSSFGVVAIWILTGVEQHANDIDVAELCSPRERTVSKLRTGRQQRSTNILYPAGRGSRSQVDRRSSAHESLDGFPLAVSQRRAHRSMTPEIAGGDVDVDVEDAYFTGEEAPGGDNPTPDQDVVDDIGKALGVEYADNEELKSSDKVVERDKHRWELDPASAEDYKERK